jgi:hypothetical protein
MKTTILIMRPGTDSEVIIVDLPEQPGYHELRNLLTPLLDGGDLEHVSVLHGTQRADMFVDDEGVRKQLPRNDTATRIYRNNWLTEHPGTDPESLPAIHGPAILFSRIVWI